jgi:hypothetical protein
MQPQGSVWRIAVLLYLSTCDICFEIFNRIHFTVLGKLKSLKEICDLQSTIVHPHLTIIWTVTTLVWSVVSTLNLWERAYAYRLAGHN